MNALRNFVGLGIWCGLLLSLIVFAAFGSPIFTLIVMVFLGFGFEVIVGWRRSKQRRGDSATHAAENGAFIAWIGFCLAYLSIHLLRTYSSAIVDNPDIHLVCVGLAWDAVAVQIVAIFYGLFALVRNFERYISKLPADAKELPRKPNLVDSFSTILLGIAGIAVWFVLALPVIREVLR